MSETYMPLSQINTYVFCPRRFYYESVEGHQIINAHVEEGKIKHEHVHTEMKNRRKGDKTISHRQYLASDTLGVSGYTDLVEEKNGVPYPVEFKKAGMGNWLNDQVQLCLQGMLLEEKTGVSIPHGYIFYIGSKRRRKVPFDAELRETTRRYLNEARALLASRKIPKPVHDNRCNGCSMRPVCLPDEVAYLHELDERPKRIKPALGIENVLYVDEPGCAIKKTGERILVARENEVIRDIPLIHLGQVVISGNVNLTTPAMQTLLHEGIPVVFLSAYGRYHGALTPQVSRNSLLRRAQHRVADNAEKCLALSKAFVHGKIWNMRTMLQRRKWRAEKGAEDALAPLLASIKAMHRMQKRIPRATELTQLLGIEGNASAEYFRSFAFMLKSEMGFGFER